MRQYHNSHLSFIDLLFNALIVFAALFMFSFMLINKPTPPNSKKVDERAKVMITMTWDDNSNDDMDLWLKTPEPSKVGFNSPNGNIANLARDDLGLDNDKYHDEYGVLKYIHLNKEVINIRHMMNGHYVVNVMFYQRKRNPETNLMSIGPQQVIVQVTQLDPDYKEIITKEVTVNESDQRNEVTAVSFDISDGQIINVDTISQEHFIREQVGTRSQ